MEATLTNVFKAGVIIQKKYLLEIIKPLYLQGKEILLEGIDLEYNLDSMTCKVSGICASDELTGLVLLHYTLDMDDDYLFDTTLDKKILRKLFKENIIILLDTVDYPEMYENIND